MRFGDGRLRKKKLSKITPIYARSDRQKENLTITIQTTALTVAFSTVKPPRRIEMRYLVSRGMTQLFQHVSNPGKNCRCHYLIGNKIEVLGTKITETRKHLIATNLKTIHRMQNLIP